MKKLNIHPQIILQEFYGFAKASKNKKIEDLMVNGILLDSTDEKDNKVLLYFLRGFFVEFNISGKNGEVTDILPIKQGYRFEHFFEVKQKQNPMLSPALQSH